MEPQGNDEHEELTVRTDPDATTTSERDALGQYLDYQRETILLKTEGLSKEQLGRPIPTSGLTLAGLLYHLAFVEEDWFEVDYLGLNHLGWLRRLAVAGTDLLPRLLADPGALSNPFFLMSPDWLRLPMVGLATLAGPESGWP